MASPVIELQDVHGNTLTFGNFGDLLIPAFPHIQDYRQHRDSIINMPILQGDVLMTGFAKTGNHWLREIVLMLMAGRPEYEKGTLSNGFLDASGGLKTRDPPNDAPSVFFTHVKYQHIPKQVLEKKTKVIYLERNPKDTWVSFYNHSHIFQGKFGYQGTWSQFFDLMISFGYWYGDWFDYVLEWEKNIELLRKQGVPVFVSAFEDLKRDPVGQIEKLDQFLGYNRSRELYEQIAEACKFTKLKKTKDDAMPEQLKKMWFKKETDSFYRKGEVGDWKNWFTVAQSELFDQVYQKRMAGSKLKYTYVQ